MNNTYKENFEQIRKAYPVFFAALEKCCSKLQVDFYLIGAQSRNVWTSHLHLPIRITSDVDYCVYVPDRQTWNRLTVLLIQEGLTRDKKLPYRYFAGSEMMDLIPFGGFEENGEVVLEDPTMELSVVGCKEVTEDAVIIDGPFKVVTLVGSCIMKLVAYHEKPDRRAKDFHDYLFLVSHYDQIAAEELFAGPNDDLLEENFELKTACARMLGRNMQRILNKNARLKTIILEVLTNKLFSFSLTDIDEMYGVRDADDKQTEELKLIAETIRGIND